MMSALRNGIASTMKKVLSVAEKNDASKRIAELLAGGAGNVRRKEGKSKYNKLYEFKYQMQGQWCDMTMTSVSGHLLNYDFSGAYRNWQSVRPVELFDAPVHKICPENSKPIKDTLEALARSAQVLIIWTDCDREGENIGFEIINVCRAINPRLDVFRAKFSEITPTAITRAINNLGRPDERVSNAVDVRQELDLRIGAAFTRLQTLRLQAKFPAIKEAKQMVSYGSCQFPTLGFVVERYRSIQDFVPEDFWKIEVKHKKDKCSVDFKWARGRLFDEDICVVIHENLKENPKAKVVKVTSKPKSKWRPVALDTVEFEKLASRKLKINAKEAMKIAEKLYTAGIISYPRTETNIFPKGLDLAPLVQQQTGDQRWGDFAQNLVQAGQNPRNGKKSDQAHPPIHPTRAAGNLTGNEAKVYELIVRHFLACCSKDALGCEVVVEIKIVDEMFVASGLTVLERNYLDVYPYDKWSDKELPNFQEGEEFIPQSIDLGQGETSAPNLLTEADLIALMEKHGIGTDATHAEHIETVKNRQYIGEHGDGRFVPGLLGMSLVEGYDTMGLNVSMSKPDLRAELEADLKRICDGIRQPNVVLREQLDTYREVFCQAEAQISRIESAVAKYTGGQPPPPAPPGPPGNSNAGRPLPAAQPRAGPNAPAARGGGAAGQARRAPGGGAARRCTVCQQLGHNRRNCPSARS